MSRNRVRLVALVAAILWLCAQPAWRWSHPASPKEPPPPRSNFVRLLSLIPDTPETRFDVTLVDYDRLFTSLGISRPVSTRSDAENEQLWLDLAAGWRLHGFNVALGYAGELGMLSGIGEYAEALPTTKGLGYGLGDIDGYVFAGRDPTGQEAVVGRFDKDRVTQRISLCPDCGITATAAPYAGSTYYAWAADFQTDLRTRLQAPAFDGLGVGGRLAVSSGYVMRTQWSAGMEQMLDAAAGHTRSLAEDPDIVLIARALDSMGAVSAYVSYCTWSWPRVQEYWKAVLGQDDAVTRLIRQRSGDEAADAEKKSIAEHLSGLFDEAAPPADLLLAYEAYSVASGIRGGQPFTALALLQSTPDQAKENAARLRARLGSTVTYSGRQWPDASTIDISVAGRLVTARFPRAISPKELLYSVNLLAFQ